MQAIDNEINIFIIYGGIEILSSSPNGTQAIDTDVVYIEHNV